MQVDQKSSPRFYNLIFAVKSAFNILSPDIHLKNNDYRPDIDGLRAIAVLAVVIFHAFPSLTGGGFVGVDVFFVISGYLISKHIWEELDTGTFSIKTFYARRVRRIFPALSAVLFFCMVMGWLILTPGEYEQLGKHTVAGAAFISNIILWNESGYFDNAANTKPLLHLWSLGIEEQFYIVWPLFLFILWRYIRHLGWILSGILGVSLAFSIIVVRHDAVADFYSPLTRFWELALGAGLAYQSAHKPVLSKLPSLLISWIGLGLILIAVFILNPGYEFPGAWALLPTLGAACLIYAGQHTWLNRKLLSNRLLVWVGLISYPLYLWHWPLLTFARIMESGAPSIKVRFWLVATGFVLAWLTYQFIERPIRAKSRSKYVVLILFLVMLFIGVTGLITKKMHGFKANHLSKLNGDISTIVLGADREKLRNECGIAASQQSIFPYCLRSGADPHYALLGDSKGEALFYGLVRESKHDMKWIMIGTVYPPELEPLPDDLQQLKNRLAFQTIIQNPAIKVVTLTMAMRTIFSIKTDSGFIVENVASSPKKIAEYNFAIQQLELAGKRVVFFIDNPTFPDPTSCISGGMTSSSLLNQFLRRKENPYCTIRYSDHLAGTKAYRQFIEELKRLHPNLIVYDPTPLLCDIPHNLCTITQEGKFLYSYSDHISDYANSKIARDMLPMIRNLVH